MAGTVRTAWRASATVASGAPAARRALLPFMTPPPPVLDFLAPAWIRPLSYTSSSCVSPPVRWPQSRQASTAHAQSQTSPVQAHPRRTLSTTTTARAPAKAILNPRTDDDGNVLTINITPRAAQRLQAIAATDQNPDLALRVTVESGGCHGFQYLMSLTSTTKADAEEDTIFESEEVGAGKAGEAANGEGYRAKVVMDEPSLELLKGSSVDYTMELIGSQFKVTGIPGAKSSCGCGTSFDIAL